MAIKKLFEELNIIDPYFESFDIAIGGYGFADVYKRYNIIIDNISFTPRYAFVIQKENMQFIVEMNKWCDENNICYHHGMLVHTIINTCWIYLFNTKPDAVVFKLRWL